MALKKFKAESQRLMDLMINSIYTNKEIFLRELISNASDAIDKLYYRALTDNISGLARDDFYIELGYDKEARLLTLDVNGIGMTKEELENNLGVIAKSGSLDFRATAADNPDVDIIGQFGVGFYSAFMVADCVTVISRAFGSDEAWCWQSKGADGYTVTASEKETHGTHIILHIRPDTEEEKYGEYLDPYRLRGLVRKYSDYIRYPIRMEMEHTETDEDGGTHTHTDVTTLNSMVPLWRKNKNEITEEEYAEFYKDKFHDFEPPMRTIHSSVEGAATYRSLLFIPARKPYNYYSRDYEKGLQLYASGVLIMDKCADLIPDHFSFVRGLVDSQDLSLNISREMLQHDHQLKAIASRIEKKIQSELTAMLNGDREQYEKFFEQFGLQLKFGVYNDFGMHKDLLRDLLLFVSSFEDKPVTLAEYVKRMPEDQKFIYYATGESPEKIRRMPQAEPVLDKGYELLYLTEDVDEFALRVLQEYEGKEFKSVSADDLGLDEPAADDAEQKDYTALFAAMKDALGDKVSAVRLSKRLKSHPVCLTADGEISLEMEKVLNSMPNGGGVKADRVLELNEQHPVFAKLLALLDADKEKLGAYSMLLYDQALMIEGLSVDDPVAFADAVSRLMADS